MSEVTRIKQQKLEKQLASLTQDYQAVSDDYNNQTDALTRNRLKRKMDELEQEMDEIDNDLRALESAGGDNNRKHLDLEEKLPKIDYEQVETILKEIFGDRAGHGRAAFFLLQNSNSLGGKWGVCRMRDLLQEA